MKRIIPIALALALFVCCMVLPASAASSFNFEFDPWLDGEYNHEFKFNVNTVYEDDYEQLIVQRITANRVRCQDTSLGGNQTPAKYIYTVPHSTSIAPEDLEFSAISQPGYHTADIVVSTDRLWFPYSVDNLADPYYRAPSVTTSLRVTGGEYVFASCTLVVAYSDGSQERFTLMANRSTAGGSADFKFYFEYPPSTQNDTSKHFSIKTGAQWYRILWNVSSSSLDDGEALTVWQPSFESVLNWRYDGVYKEAYDSFVSGALGDIDNGLNGGNYTPPSQGAVNDATGVEDSILDSIAQYKPDLSTTFNSGLGILGQYTGTFKAYHSMFDNLMTEPYLDDNGNQVYDVFGNPVRVQSVFYELLQISLALGALVVILGIVVHATSVTQQHERLKLAEAHRDMRAAQPKTHYHYHFRR